jgi:hypothetical protein
VLDIAVNSDAHADNNDDHRNDDCNNYPSGDTARARAGPGRVVNILEIRSERARFCSRTAFECNVSLGVKSDIAGELPVVACERR